MAKLLLNVVSVSCNPDFKVTVGIQPYDQDKLHTLRSKYRGDYLVKRGGTDGDFIHAVPLKDGLQPLGPKTEELTLSTAPWLLAPLTIEGLLTTFQRLERPVLKWRPLRIQSQQPRNIFPEDSGLPPWIQRRIVLDFETRIVRGHDRGSTVVLCCGVRTRNSIDATCAELIAAGLPLVGRYVSVLEPSDDPRVRGTLSLKGRVSAIRGSILRLEDCSDSANEIDAQDAFLEPRIENLSWCVQHLLGAKAQRVLEAASDAASKHLSGPNRLEFIRRTFEYLRKQQIDLAPGIPLLLGPIAGTERGSWPFRTEVIPKPALVFDPSGTRTDRWNERGLDQNGPYDQRTFTPKQLRIAVICQSAHEGQVEAFLAKFLEGLPDVKTVSGNYARAPYAKGFIRRYGLEAPKVQTFTAAGPSAEAYLDACRRALRAATDGGFEWNLALVQIDQNFRELDVPNNPYFATKAAFLKQRVPVQEITLETMGFSNQQLVFALNNMSVAAYAKLGGIPWLLKSDPTVAHELVIGIGSHTFSQERLGRHERVVGITTVFNSDGKYILDDRTGAVPYDQYKEALHKTLSRSIETVRRIDNWRSTDAVRLIFHVFKQVADKEADAVGALVESLSLGEVKFAFVHVVDNHPFTIFDQANPGFHTRDGPKGALAAQRGTAISFGNSETLLCFTGGRDIKQARHGMPQPALLRLHRRSTFRDMTYLTRQAFNFSCHSWRMFTPAPQPITIHYSELIARLLTGLSKVPHWDPDAMLGAVSRTRWFL